MSQITDQLPYLTDQRQQASRQFDAAAERGDVLAMDEARAGMGSLSRWSVTLTLASTP